MFLRVLLYILLCNCWFIQYDATAVVGESSRYVGISSDYLTLGLFSYRGILNMFRSCTGVLFCVAWFSTCVFFPDAITLVRSPSLA